MTTHKHSRTAHASIAPLAAAMLVMGVPDAAAAPPHAMRPVTSNAAARSAGVGVLGAGMDGGVAACSDAAVRSAIAAAGDGDVVDLGGLVRCTITLVGGELPVDVDNLTLRGPADGSLTIDGNDLARVLAHSGSGTLAIDRMILARGRAAGRGGCISSNGSIVLNRVTVTGCTAADSGGGVFASQVFTADDSTISDNASDAWGGGVGTFYGNIDVTRCTFSGNRAGTIGGALYSFYGTHVGIGNSTISGNVAAIKGGATAAWAGLSVHDSTIAFNASLQEPGGGFHVAHGPVEITGSIVSGNTGHFAAGDGASDIYSDDGSIVVDGSHDLVTSSTLALPADTLSADPGLAPLADNGGPTLTHAIAADSPAFEAGANPDLFGSDQRGDGYVRTFGAAPDIGAFELQAPPSALDDAFTTAQGSMLVIAAPGVLGNDNDAFGRPLVAAVLDPPAHGTLVLDADGGFEYTPDAAYAGTDHFTYTADDGLGTSEPATVTITITPDDTLFADGFDAA